MRPPDQGGGRSLAFPDYDQAVAFHNALAERMGAEDWGPIEEQRLKSALERAHQATAQRGDLISSGAFMLFGLIRDKPFGKGSIETGLALTLAFLMRHGAGVEAPDEEIAGISIGISEGEVYAGMVEMWLREYARPIRF